jgi:hypothetical protein
MYTFIVAVGLEVFLPCVIGGMNSLGLLRRAGTSGAFGFVSGETVDLLETPKAEGTAVPPLLLEGRQHH